MTSASARLRPYIWAYGMTVGRVTAEPRRVPLPARPKQLLTFFFGDPYRVLGPKPLEAIASPRVTVVGPQTHAHAGLSIFGTIDSFTVHYQPAGFYRLFGVPMTELTDAAYDAYSVIGTRLPRMEDELASAATLKQRVAIFERHAVRMLDGYKRCDAVGLVANRLFQRHGRDHVSALAAEVNLSPRQFERRFLAQVGVPPKLYSRIIRFNAALNAKLSLPSQPWSRVANDCHYYDQAHLLRDCRAFTSEAPQQFVAHLELLPAFHSFYATQAVPHGANSPNVSRSSYQLTLTEPYDPHRARALS